MAITSTVTSTVTVAAAAVATPGSSTQVTLNITGDQVSVLIDMAKGAITDPGNVSKVASHGPPPAFLRFLLDFFVAGVVIMGLFLLFVMCKVLYDGWRELACSPRSASDPESGDASDASPDEKAQDRETSSTPLSQPLTRTASTASTFSTASTVVASEEDEPQSWQTTRAEAGRLLTCILDRHRANGEAPFHDGCPGSNWCARCDAHFIYKARMEARFILKGRQRELNEFRMMGPVHIGECEGLVCTKCEGLYERWLRARGPQEPSDWEGFY